MKKFGKKAGLKSTKSSHSAVSGGAPSPTSPGMDMDDEFDPSDTEYDMVSQAGSCRFHGHAYLCGVLRHAERGQNGN